MQLKAHAGRFIVEIDGFAALRATKITGLKSTLDTYEISPGDTNSPEYGRAKFKCEVIEITQAQALNATGRALAQYFDDYKRGITSEKKTLRFIQLKDDGVTTHGVHTALRCMVTEFGVSDGDGASKDAATWTVKLQPEDLIHDFDG